MKNTIENMVKGALAKLGVEPVDFVVEHPGEIGFGDYSTNVAMVLSKQLGKSPKEVAEEIMQALQEEGNEYISLIKIAGPGFINFYLTNKFFSESIQEVIDRGSSYGKNSRLAGQKVMVEYTDPNVMKPFHIGHLMSNSIGEAISRIIEWQGANVIRVNYYSDSGLNIAKAIWGVRARIDDLPDEGDDLKTKAEYLGACYAYGVKQSSEDEKIEAEVREINRKIFDHSDEEVNRIYELGKRWSLEYFSDLYEKLGSKFEWSIGESEIAEDGKAIVEEFLDKGVFKKGEEGAVVFQGEKYNPHLHTRVFINKENLPTYEAKELGLTKKKFEKFDLDRSIVITANEQNDYFKVVIEAMKQVMPDQASKTLHLSHGMMRLPSGKMSSRTGQVITAESFIEEVKKAIREKGNEPSDDIAVGAIKYTILRQATGNDIIFDFDKSISTEGDSGPYLQYAYARTNSLLEKAKEAGITSSVGQVGSRDTHGIERILYRFPEVVERAGEENAPNYLVTYLTELAASFNNFYAHEQIVSEDEAAPYRVAITEAFNVIMRNGLDILGIPSPERI